MPLAEVVVVCVRWQRSTVRRVRVFVAGASGVLGARLVPLLIADGHDVAAMTRSPQKADALARTGAHPVVCDVFDQRRLDEVIADFAPAVVMHQLTDLPDDREKIPEHGAAHARIRIEGTDNLIRAAQSAGTEKVIAQSVAWERCSRRVRR